MGVRDPGPKAVDLLVIGGGINGACIARDAAGRGLDVLLCEKDDLAAHTSSASTKLIHGGLRYLEHYDFRLVRHSLREREVLLSQRPAHRLAPAFRAAAPRRAAAPVDDPAGPVPLRPPRRARAVAALREHRSAPAPERTPVEKALSPGVRVLGLLGAGRAPGGAQRPRCASAGRGRAHPHRMRLARASRPALGGDAGGRGHGQALHRLGKERGQCERTVGGRDPRSDRRRGRECRCKRGCEARHGARAGRRPGGRGCCVPGRRRHEARREAREGQPHRRREAVRAPASLHLPGRGRPGTVRDPLRGGVHPARNHRGGDRGRAGGRSRSRRGRWTTSAPRPTRTSRNPFLPATSSGRTPASAPCSTTGHGTRARSPATTCSISTGARRPCSRCTVARSPPAAGSPSRPWTCWPGRWASTGRPGPADAPLPGGDVPGADVDGFVARCTERYPWLAQGLARHYVRHYGTGIHTLLAGRTGAGDLGEHFGAGLHAAEIEYLVEHEWAPHRRGRPVAAHQEGAAHAGGGEAPPVRLARRRGRRFCVMLLSGGSAAVRLLRYQPHPSAVALRRDAFVRQIGSSSALRYRPHPGAAAFLHDAHVRFGNPGVPYR